MRIGVYRAMPWFAGGGFQYEITLLDALSDLVPRLADELVCVSMPDDDLRSLASAGGLCYRNLPMQLLGTGLFQQAPVAAYINQPEPEVPALDVDTLYVNSRAAEDFRSAGIDWVFQIQPGPMAFSALMPFVMPIHDLQHRLQPEFDEVSAGGQWQLREYWYTNVCRFATLVIVESEQGKADLLRFYGEHIGEDRIRVLPLYPPRRRLRAATPADARRVAEKYCLPERFMFYPAQFWRHKNHHLIVEALALIRRHHGLEIPVVFSGSYADRLRALNIASVFGRAEELGVKGLVHYVGFAAEEEMPALYHLATALVMPTFFGPSNIPGLEAWQYGRPVITSDIPGIREQTADGGLLVDPRSAEDLANAMVALWTNEALCRDLAARGQMRLASFSWDGFVSRVGEIVGEASARVRAGQTPRYPG